MGLYCLKNGHDFYEGRCRICGKKYFDSMPIGRKICESKKHIWNGCTCIRCGAQNRKGGEVIGHNFVDDSCVCQICGTLRPHDDPGHDWAEAAPGSDLCQTCRRCGRVSRKHQLDENRVCIYCGKTSTDIEYEKMLKRRAERLRNEHPPCAHEWEQNVKVPFGPGVVYGKRCKKCGKTQPYEIHV